MNLNASEHGSEKAPEHGSEKPPEKGTEHGNEEKKSGEEKKPGESGGHGGEPHLELKSKGQRNYEDYMDYVKQLQSAEAKVKSKYEAMQELIHEKEKEKDKKKLSLITKDLNQIYKEYVGFVEQYNKVRGVVMYRFPEHGELQNEGYQRIQKQTIEEVEHTLSVEGKIKKIMKTMKTQYKVRPESSAQSADKSAANAPSNGSGSSDPEDRRKSQIEKARPDVTQPIRISK